MVVYIEEHPVRAQNKLDWSTRADLLKQQIRSAREQQRASLQPKEGNAGAVKSEHKVAAQAVLQVWRLTPVGCCTACLVG